MEGQFRRRATVACQVFLDTPYYPKHAMETLGERQPPGEAYLPVII